VVHGHCHQKAIVGMGPTTEVLSRVEGLEFTRAGLGVLRDGGLVRLREGPLRRVEGVRRARPLPRRARGAAPDDLVVAPGFSCRHQISDFCAGRKSLHTAELLAMAE
jgi:glycerol-3-phosphate dehydrogenase subunit C